MKKKSEPERLSEPRVRLIAEEQRQASQYARSLIAVKTERQKFYDVLEMLPAYVVLLTTDYHVPFANRFFRERFGESCGRRCYEYLFDRTGPCPICETYTVMKTNEPHHWEWTGPDSRNYDIFDFPFTDTDGSPLIMEVGIDITERKRAEEGLRKVNETLEQRIAERTGALRESEEQFRSLTENSPDCIALHDTELRHIYVNPAIVELIGLPLEAFVGKTTFEMDMPSEVASQLDAMLRRALETGQRQTGELFFPTPGGTRFYLWRSVPIFGVDGTIRAILAIAGDITERKKAEQDVLKLSEDMAARNVELETVNKELESFIYSISHDLRAPVRSMAGFAKIMVEDYSGRLDEQGRDYLLRIHRSSEKMTLLIDNLLYLSKISRQEMEKTEVDMSKMASSIIAVLQEANPGRRVTVHIEDGLTVSADRRLMEIILSNLIGNAWKFTSKTENARIELGANPPLHLSQEGTIYYVRDNGAGFDPEYSGKMFRPFHRLHSDDEFEGTGIGLTIVERLIHRHGGRVWAEGEKGKGATAYFTLG